MTDANEVNEVSPENSVMQNSNVLKFSTDEKDGTPNEALPGEYPPAVKRYGFSLGDTHLLVPEGEYCELIVDFKLSLLPNSPEHLLGVMNLRGNLVPLYQTPALKQTNNTLFYAFLIGKPKNGAAILIDSKPRSIDILPNHKELAIESPDWLSGCTTKMYDIEGEPWSDLNSNALFRKLASQPLIS